MKRIWIAAYHRGLRHLSHHNPQEALKEFRKALEGCSVSDAPATSQVLYYLGLAVLRSGYPGLAAKSWVNGRKMLRRGRLAKACGRWVNGYGMYRRSNSVEDDFYAFRSIQIARYLASRGAGRFGSQAERDVVYELILDAWKVLEKSTLLTSLGPSEKLALFKRARVDLPFMYIEDALAGTYEALVVDFRSGKRLARRIKEDDRCPCGSGLPRRMCCGRITSCTELESGSH